MNSQLLTAAEALLADVRRRYPGEPLRCPHMIALDQAVAEGKTVLSKMTPEAMTKALKLHQEIRNLERILSSILSCKPGKGIKVQSEDSSDIFIRRGNSVSPEGYAAMERIAQDVMPTIANSLRREIKAIRAQYEELGGE